ncbi:MAG: proprotein convertase P-domain-containing protein [Saprospiraceae bacterium]|nr:proprotein convertase P-domain-containing protein [Saprospiraceae bacterium]
MPDGFTESFVLQVNNAQNQVIGLNGQAVCGVSLHFTHEYVGDLQITLQAPNGTTVTLIGPVGFFDPTNGTTWDIEFLPCSETADPDNNFAAQWSNDQTWGILGKYNGTYHPFSGCLEDFAGSPVNGEWTLVVVDGLPDDEGVFLGYGLIFCDQSGIECTPCKAGAGNLLDNDLEACAGNESLLLLPTPQYANQQNPPPDANYNYTYLISGNSDVLLAYADTADLRGFAPGTYSVCGMSYLQADSTLLPAPNDTLTVQELALLLKDPEPPFCGDVTTNCINVRILPLPPDSFLVARVCPDSCFLFFGKSYCADGQYTDTIVNGNCSFTAALDLTVDVRDTIFLSETVCSGQCATSPGFEQSCAQGIHSRTFTNINGCDSLVVLSLTMLDPSAAILPPAPWPCGQERSLLVASSLPASATLAWTAVAPAAFEGPGDRDTLVAVSPGTFRVSVCQNDQGKLCCDTAETTVFKDTTYLATPTWVTTDSFLCATDTLTVRTAGLSGATGALWSWPTGLEPALAPIDTAMVLIWKSGPGGAVCWQAFNACDTTERLCMTVLVGFPPQQAVVSGPQTVCAGSAVWYAASAVAGDSIIRTWTVEGGDVIAQQGLDSILVLWDNGGLLQGKIELVVGTACGKSLPTSLNVTVNYPPDEVKLMGDSIFCAGAESILLYQAPSDATALDWKIPPFAQVSSTTTPDTLTVFWPVPGQGTLCVTAENGCGKGAETCLNVTVFAVPVADAGPLQEICGLQSVVLAAPAAGGRWLPVQGITLQSPDSAQTQVTADAPGLYELVWMVAQNNCMDSDSTVLVFRETPKIDSVLPSCTTDTAGFLLQIRVQGGQIPYQAVGLNGVFNGDLFSSGLLPNQATVQFFAVDANGCPSDTLLFGGFTCACKTWAGNMPQTIVHLCAGDTLYLPASDNFILDTGDTLVYVLHDQNGASLGNVYSENAEPVFVLSPWMDFDKTYFVSAVAYRKDDPGQSPCTSVSNGTPVVWHTPPVATVTGEETACAGDTIIWWVGGSGTAPLTIQLEDNGGNRYTVSATDQNPAPFPVAALQSGIWRVIGVADAFCSDQPAGLEKSLTVNPLPIADAGPDGYLTCSDSLIELDGSGSDGMGQTLTHTWSAGGEQVGAAPVLQTRDTGHFVLLVRTASGCGSEDSAYVEDRRDVPFPINLVAEPVRCFGEQNGRISMDGVGGGAQPILLRLNGGELTDETVFENLPPGVYTLEIIDANGCQSSLNIEIAEPAEIILNLGPNQEAAFGDEMYLNYQVNIPSNEVDTVVWVPLPAGAIPEPEGLRWIADASMVISATLVDTQGCEAKDSILIRVIRKDRIYVPNVFSPGSSGNDIWWVFAGPEVAVVAYAAVYDRWGNLLFERKDALPNDLSQGWDGRSADDFAEPGVYVYYLRLRYINGETADLGGNFTLLR